MLIIITSEQDIPNEIALIHQLFAAGLEILHVRKPSFSATELNDFISSIDKKHHSKIMIHSHHQLIKTFNLKGLHFTEKERKKQEAIAKIEKHGSVFSYSSSFHSVEAIKNNNLSFDYVFLSPVYDAISKQGYSGKDFNIDGIDQKIIALGGITKTTITKTKALGYDGIAMLGAIWNAASPSHEIEELKPFLTNQLKKTRV